MIQHFALELDTLLNVILTCYLLRGLEMSSVTFSLSLPADTEMVSWLLLSAKLNLEVGVRVGIWILCEMNSREQ